MRMASYPKGSIAGVTTAVVALGLFASWTWHRGGGFGLLKSSAPLPSAAVSRASSVELIAPSRTAWQPPASSPAATGLADASGDAVAWRRDARPMPPAGDRVYREPGVGEGSARPTIALPRRSTWSTAGVIPSADDGLLSASETAHLARHMAENAPDIAACWPLPVPIMTGLEQLRARGVAGDWVDRVAACLRQLHEVASLGDPRAADLLDELSALVATAMEVFPAHENLDDRAQLQRVAFSLERRLGIWHGVHMLSRPVAAPVSLSSSGCDTATMTRRLDAVDKQLARLDNVDTWRQYLLLDHIRRMEAQRWSACAAERSQLARAILTRLSVANETPDQRAFFADPAWEAFHEELRTWVVEPVDYEQLLDELERWEATGAEDAARSVAECYQLMRWSSSPLVADVGQRINTYYRNANVRVAISAELVNRLLPPPATVDEPVNDTLLGGRVLGRSRVSTRLSLILFPDREQWKMELEAQGNVDSNTETKRGPAVFHNAGRARYLARKLLLMDHRGLRTEEAEAAAISNANLTRLETDLDGVPLINLLVRAIARQQYDSKANEAKGEAENLLASRAQMRMDAEVEKQLLQATDQFRSQVLEPLEAMELRPETVDLETTEQRLIGRYRLASYHQVAAFTPRPQAPADSLLSVQIHESALNNVVASLQLNQGETDLPSLFRDIAARFHRDNYEVPEDVPTDVRLRLAQQDPISVSCSDDRIQITLRIARLEGGDHNVFRDFEVRAAYLPDVDGLHVRLVRDGFVRLKGRRLSMGDQVALRGVFSRVLAQRPAVDLMGNFLVRDNRLHDLRVTQFVVREGWIGVSIGPGKPVKDRVADMPADVRRK
jgi:hypothetical protein